MCGIAGFFDFKNQNHDLGLIKAMTDAITHRGPDADGFLNAGAIQLGMRRLKVIDLESGNQPIHDAQRRFGIIFNGEIYNYRELRDSLQKLGHQFETHSDTEVILHLFMEKGAACLHDLIGMFAFCIYDSANQTLFLARDRLGIKPLFYHYSEAGFAFGSELKSILKLPWISNQLDLQSLSHYLSLNYLPAPWTPLEAVKHLDPGHWMKISRGNIEIQEYWDIPREILHDITESEALTEIEKRFHKSIERRLIADVPIGAFLSGGLDSSTIVAFLREHKQGQLKTFSVGFDHPSYDETPYAREVAKFYGTDHYEIKVTPEDVTDFLPKVSWHADNLLADQAALALYVVSKLAREHVTVCLSGDGGDEIFVGYPTFLADQYHQIYLRTPVWLRHGIIEKLVHALPASSDKLSFDYKARKFIEAGNFEGAKAHYWWRTIFTDEEKKDLIRPDILKKIPNLDAFETYNRHFKKVGHLEFGNQALYADLKVWLAGNNLYKVDTMTMAHGLEGRVPFLDHELVEFMAKLPFHLKFKGNILKRLQKKLMKGKLPPAILKRKKAGWHMPIAAWMKGPLTKRWNEHPLHTDKYLGQYFNPEAVKILFDNHQSGRYNCAFKIWGLAILQSWLQQYERSSVHELKF